MESLDNCTDASETNVGSTGDSDDLAFSESVALVSTIFLSSVQPVIVNCLCFDLFDLDFFTVQP